LNSKQHLYRKGDQVWINKLFVIGEVTMETKNLVDPIIATVAEVRKQCSEPFGFPYVLILPDSVYESNICAGVCYWETDIICKFEDEEDLIWKVWGDQ
tara:strand:+ start:8239 stop:8532 length:294 start_codon:yes stop_codon:yes gene_type:complete